MQYKKIIQTKYMPPTHTRGSRIKAIESGGNTVVMPYDSEFDVEQNHRICAQMLIDKVFRREAKTKTSYELMTLDSCGGFGSGYIFTALLKTFHFNTTEVTHED